MDLGQLMEGESGLALSVGKMCQLVGLNVELGRKRHLRVARGRARILVTLDMNSH